MLVTPLVDGQRVAIAWGNDGHFVDPGILLHFAWSAFCVQWIAVGWAALAGDEKYVELPMLAARVDCQECGCEREAGHDGQHMSRGWEAQTGLEVVAEW